MKRIGTCTFAAVFSLAIAAHAASIPVPNFSFNDPEVADGTSNNLSRQIPGWSPGGFGAGVRDPVNAQYSGASGDNALLPGTADGGQTAFLPSAEGNPVAISTTTGITLQPNTVYLLTVAVGNPLDANPGDVSLKLTADSIGLATTTIGHTSIPEGTFTDFSLSMGPFPATHFLIGDPLGIEIGISGRSITDIDNVRLTATVPEPACAVMLLAALAAGLRRARR